MLQQCGVTAATLTPAERAALDEQGYVILPNLVDAAWLSRQSQ